MGPLHKYAMFCFSTQSAHVTVPVLHVIPSTGKVSHSAAYFSGHIQRGGWLGS